MTRRTTLFAVLAALALVATAVAATPIAAQPADQSDGADRGPADGQGPPDFLGDRLGDVVPDFVADLLGSLSVPEFLTGLF